MAHLKRFVAAGMTLAMVVGMLPVTTMAAASYRNEWHQKSDGYWYFYDEYGHKVKNEVKYCSDDGCYYLLNSKGQRVTKKGFITTTKLYTHYGDKISFKRSYYVKEGGALLTSSWKKISGTWRYFNYDGMMLKGTATYKSTDAATGKHKFWLLGNDGKKVSKKGWYKAKTVSIDNWDGDKYTYEYYYYVLSDGTVARDGVKKIGGKYYAFGYDGIMVRNDTYTSSSGKNYLYGDDGARIKKAGLACVTYKSTYYGSISVSKDTYKVRYYINKDGSVYSGWKKIDGKWYYFSTSTFTPGVMLRSTTNSNIESGKTYIFNSKGVCINHG